MRPELGTKTWDDLLTKWVLLVCKPDVTDRLGLTVQLPEKVYVCTTHARSTYRDP